MQKKIRLKPAHKYKFVCENIRFWWRIFFFCDFNILSSQDPYLQLRQPSLKEFIPKRNLTYSLENPKYNIHSSKSIQHTCTRLFMKFWNIEFFNQKDARYESGSLISGEKLTVSKTANSRKRSSMLSPSCRRTKEWKSQLTLSKRPNASAQKPRRGLSSELSPYFPALHKLKAINDKWNEYQ